MKKRVAIISGAPIGLSPYLKFYIDVLNENGVEWLLLNVEPDESREDDSQHKVFRCALQPGVVHRLKRLVKGFFFIHNNLKKFGANRLIVAPTRTGIRLRSYLRLYWKNRFIFDIRDFTRENEPRFLNHEARVIAASYATYVSSKGFVEWLPCSEKIKFVNNIPAHYEKEKCPKLQNNEIRIGSVGMVAYYKQNSALIQALGDKPGFQLLFCGDPVSAWTNEKIAEAEQYANVHFTGHFDNCEKPNIYRSVDLINCLYGSDEINPKTLTPNRLYDAAIYKIPIMLSSGTFSASLAEKYGIGFGIDIFSEDVAAVIHNWFIGLDSETFAHNCERFLADVELEQDRFRKDIRSFAGVE